MVVTTFHADTDFAALQAVLPDKERQIALLRSQGRMGALHMSFARRTAFAGIMAADEKQAAATVPLSTFFDIDIDVYPTPSAGPSMVAAEAWIEPIAGVPASEMEPEGVPVARKAPTGPSP